MRWTEGVEGARPPGSEFRCCDPMRSSVPFPVVSSLTRGGEASKCPAKVPIALSTQCLPKLLQISAILNHRYLSNLAFVAI